MRWEMSNFRLNTLQCLSVHFFVTGVFTHGSSAIFQFLFWGMLRWVGRVHFSNKWKKIKEAKHFLGNKINCLKLKRSKTEVLDFAIKVAFTHAFSACNFCVAVRFLGAYLFGWLNWTLSSRWNFSNIMTKKAFQSFPTNFKWKPRF